jgi:PAS domain S-box-containing protein
MTLPSVAREDTTSPATVPASEGIEVLLNASAMLLSSFSVNAVVSSIVDLAGQIIKADAYAVWRTYDAANWRVLASRGLSSSYRTEVQSASRKAPGFQSVPDVEADPTLRQFGKTYKEEGIRSLLVVPLQFQNPLPDGPNAGTITFYWRIRHTPSDLDIFYASALANLSSAALNISELHEQNQREKHRLAFLAEASALLASSLDYEDTLQRVAHLAVPRIADWCTVHVLEKGVPNRLVVAHSDPEMLEYGKQYSARFPEEIREDRGLGFVLRTGQSEILPLITDEMLVAAIPNSEQLEMVRSLGITSSILLPLTSRDKVLGAIRLLSAGSNRSFNKDDVQLAEDLARRAATAIENAQLHRAVLDQENRLRLAHSAARMGTWTWDLAHQQPYWSNEWKALHGLSPETESSVELGASLIHPEDREQVLSGLAEVLSSAAEQISFEHRSIAADGRSLWIHSRGAIERDSDGKAIGIVGISMDVTERRQAEEALRKTEKLAAAGRLAATVAHEINNPLESIVNLVFLCKNTAGLPDEVAALLATADQELARIAQIVRQTLGFYRESVDPRSSDICKIVSEILDVYRPRIQARSLGCSLDLQQGIFAYVIPGEIKQVVANLIANALDATEPGGDLHISVKRVGETVAIAVADTGSGINDVHLARVFEPFFTTKTDVGTGLGLWVTKGIVEKQEGTITVASSTGPTDHGTTVTVTLPLV